MKLVRSERFVLILINCCVKRFLCITTTMVSGHTYRRTSNKMAKEMSSINHWIVLLACHLWLCYTFVVTRIRCANQDLSQCEWVCVSRTYVNLPEILSLIFDLCFHSAINLRVLYSFWPHFCIRHELLLCESNTNTHTNTKTEFNFPK